MTPNLQQTSRDERRPQEQGREPKRPYQRPTVRVMNESEVLATFQITSAFASWWW